MYLNKHDFNIHGQVKLMFNEKILKSTTVHNIEQLKEHDANITRHYKYINQIDAQL